MKIIGMGIYGWGLNRWLCCHEAGQLPMVFWESCNRNGILDVSMRQWNRSRLPGVWFTMASCWQSARISRCRRVRLWKLEKSVARRGSRTVFIWPRYRERTKKVYDFNRNEVFGRDRDLCLLKPCTWQSSPQWANTLTPRSLRVMQSSRAGTNLQKNFKEPDLWALEKECELVVSKGSV